MRANQLSLVLLFAIMAFAAAPAVRQALAEETKTDPGLSDVLTDLLHGVEGENSTSGPDKRVPFGREEVQLSFAPLVKQTAPAVVNVYASQPAKVTSPFDGDPFFEEFFGRSQPRAQSSLGSGVLVDPTGIVVTNYHVIKDADQVKVATADGREFDSKVMLKDETLDLAVLKISADKPFPVIAIGDSDALEVGDLVLAIGNPFGVGQTVTSGIVSALGRNQLGINTFENFIQTDAAINPGNSGGALVDVNGHLMGINTAIYSRSGGSMGIGFAIPVSTAKLVLEGIVKEGVVKRGWIGVEPADLSPELMETFGVKAKRGVLITGVLQNGPAAQAGVRPGDVIVEVAGNQIANVSELLSNVAALKPGTAAKFRLLRRDDALELNVTPGLRPRPPKQAPQR